MSNWCRKCPSNSNSNSTWRCVTQADVVELQSTTDETPCREPQPVGVVSIHRCNKHCNANVAASHQGKMLHLRFHAKEIYSYENTLHLLRRWFSMSTNHSRQLQHSLGQTGWCLNRSSLTVTGGDDTVRGLAVGCYAGRITQCISDKVRDDQSRQSQTARGFVQCDCCTTLQYCA